MIVKKRFDTNTFTGRVFVAQSPEVFTYDADGNISEYISESGEVVAHYDYSPFGETLTQTGDMARDFTHRFSTKPWCPITGLCEYQMRKYRPEIGRWLSRDPIGEDNGNSVDFASQYDDMFWVDAQENRSIFIRNDGLNDFDFVGCRGSGSKWRHFIQKLPGKPPKNGGPIEIITLPIEKPREKYSYEKMMESGLESCSRQYSKNIQELAKSDHAIVAWFFMIIS